MITDFTAIQKILDTQLLTVVAPTDFQGENTVRTPNSNGFVRSTLLPAQTRIAGLGPDGLDIAQGIYQVDCFTKVGTGTELGGDTVTRILEVFPKGAKYTMGTTTVSIENAWRISGRTLQNFYQIPIFIQWVVYTI